MICIGCGCDEGHACNVAGEGCSWVHIGPRRLVGICSACLELFPPSSIDLELRQAETAIAAAEAGEIGECAYELHDPGCRSPLILSGDADFFL